MDPCALSAIGAVVLSGLVLAHRLRDRGVFVLTVRAGDVTAVRGTIPATLLSDVRTLLEGTPARGTIRAVDVGTATARIELEGTFDPSLAQRLRNTLGTVPVTRLRQAPRRSR
jgi:hypothetical protein